MNFFYSIIIYSFIFLVFQTKLSTAQGIAGSSADEEIYRLVDLQTAGLLKKGSLGVNFNVMPNGILIAEIDISVLKNFSLGLSYGAVNLIGSGKLDHYKWPGFHSKLKILTETRFLPAIAIGFDSQGKGNYVDSLDRYETKSPGFFVSTLKNFKFLGYLSLHGTINYSLENNDGDDNLNFGLGIEKTIGPSISLLVEYDLGLNDNFRRSLGKKNGYLNTGIRWSATRNLTLGFDIRNLLDNRKMMSANGAERGLFIYYISNIY